MQKQAPTVGRILVMAIFTLSCFGLLLYLWSAFGGPVPLKPHGYRFETSFAEATQLAQEADVRISGVNVGRVKKLDLGNGRTDATIELDDQYAPLPQDSRAILRQKTLLGETYVELTPGTDTAPKIPEGGRLETTQVASTVELDEILRSFDKKTREGFQTWQRDLGMGIEGQGPGFSDFLGVLPEFAQNTNQVLTILNSQERAVREGIKNTGVVFDALSERDGQLRSLIENTDSVFAATAARDSELQASFRALPTFEEESRKTFERLDEFQRETDPLITQLRPAARELSPTLEDLADLAPDLKNLLEELDPLIAASKEGFPAAEQVLEDTRPTLGQLVPVTAQLTPAVDFIGLYKRELTSFFANAGSATQARDASSGLHYLRTSNPLNPENLAAYPNRLPTNRPNPYTLPNHFDQTATGLPVYEDRQCNSANLLPSITNTPIDLVNTVVDAVPTAVPPLVPGLPPVTLPPIPQIPLTPEQAEALIPDELLAQIQQYAFGVGGAGVVAPPCRKQGPFEFGGERTQYPHVNARDDG